MDELDEIDNEQGEYNPIENAHKLCILEKEGLIRIKDGEIDMDYLKRRVFQEQDRTHDWSTTNKIKHQQAFEACLWGVKRPTPEDTAFFITDCIDRFF